MTLGNVGGQQPEPPLTAGAVEWPRAWPDRRNLQPGRWRDAFIFDISLMEVEAAYHDHKQISGVRGNPELPVAPESNGWHPFLQSLRLETHAPRSTPAHSHLD